MNDVYETVIPLADRARIARIEPFDEIEEWRLMQGHYALTVALALQPPLRDDAHDAASPAADSSSAEPHFPAGHSVRDDGATFEFDGRRDPPLARLLFPAPLRPAATTTSTTPKFD
jgi:hypothetical protein